MEAQRLRRCLIPLLVHLPLGAIINIAIALAIAWFQPEGPWRDTVDSTRAHTHNSPPSGLIDVEQSAGHLVITRYEAYWPPADSIPHRSPPWWSAANERPVIDDPERPDMTNKFVEAAYGWPLVALRYEYHYRHMRVGFSGNLFFLESVEGGIVLSETQNLAHPNDWRPVFHALPYHIIPLNFAINTLLYALLIALLWFGPLHLRHRWRLHRSRCPRCAYPIGESPICTECGASLPSGPKP